MTRSSLEWFAVRNGTRRTNGQRERDEATENNMSKQLNSWIETRSPRHGFVYFLLSRCCRSFLFKTGDYDDRPGYNHRLFISFFLQLLLSQWNIWHLATALNVLSVVRGCQKASKLIANGYVAVILAFQWAFGMMRVFVTRRSVMQSHSMTLLCSHTFTTCEDHNRLYYDRYTHYNLDDWWWKRYTNLKFKYALCSAAVPISNSDARAAIFSHTGGVSVLNDMSHSHIIWYVTTC